MDDKSNPTQSPSATGLPPIEVLMPMPPVPQPSTAPEPIMAVPPVPVPTAVPAPSPVTMQAPTSTPSPVSMIEPPALTKNEKSKAEGKGVSVVVMVIVAIACLILGLGIGYFLAGRMNGVTTLPPTAGPGNTGTACTMEAKLCPDGTSVGRVGPSCEFAPCPGEGSQSTETPAVGTGEAPAVPETTTSPVAP